MTNERAIELLHRISDSQFDGIHGDERREALEMAVRALEPNLVKESGDLVQDLVKDCISRKMAIDAVKSYWKNEVDRIPKESTDFDVFTKICDSILTHNANICKAIDKLPSAQPERKKGKWIPVTNGRCGFECNQCHCYAPSYQDGVEWLSAFCPNCGARMDGESDE